MPIENRKEWPRRIFKGKTDECEVREAVCVYDAQKAFSSILAEHGFLHFRAEENGQSAENCLTNIFLAHILFHTCVFLTQIVFINVIDSPYALSMWRKLFTLHQVCGDGIKPKHARGAVLASMPCHTKKSPKIVFQPKLKKRACKLFANSNNLDSVETSQSQARTRAQ